MAYFMEFPTTGAKQQVRVPMKQTNSSWGSHNSTSNVALQHNPL